jgi:hypothetical protein
VKLVGLISKLPQLEEKVRSIHHHNFECFSGSKHCHKKRKEASVASPPGNANAFCAPCPTEMQNEKKPEQLERKGSGQGQKSYPLCYLVKSF